MCLGIIDGVGEFTCSIPGKGSGAIAQRITGSVIGVRFHHWPRHGLQAVTVCRQGIQVIGSANLSVGAIAVGVIAPELESGALTKK